MKDFEIYRLICRSLTLVLQSRTILLRHFVMSKNREEQFFPLYQSGFAPPPPPPKRGSMNC